MKKLKIFLNNGDDDKITITLAPEISKAYLDGEDIMVVFGGRIPNHVGSPKVTMKKCNYDWDNFKEIPETKLPSKGFSLLAEFGPEERILNTTIFQDTLIVCTTLGVFKCVDDVLVPILFQDCKFMGIDLSKGPERCFIDGKEVST